MAVRLFLWKGAVQTSEVKIYECEHICEVYAVKTSRANQVLKKQTVGSLPWQDVKLHPFSLLMAKHMDVSYVYLILLNGEFLRHWHKYSLELSGTAQPACKQQPDRLVVAYKLPFLSEFYINNMVKLSELEL